MTATKLAANRANAQKSTGPQNTTASRFNGLQHGMTSKQTVIPGESQQEYDEFLQGFFNDLKPQSTIEKLLVERIVVAAWRLRRFERMENAFFNDRVAAFLQDHPESDPSIALANLFVDPGETARMRLFLRYQTTVQREYDKAMSEFWKARTDREKQEMDEAILQSTRMPAPSDATSVADSAIPAPPAIAAVGFASQTGSAAAPFIPIPPGLAEVPRYTGV